MSKNTLSAVDSDVDRTNGLRKILLSYSISLESLFENDRRLINLIGDRGTQLMVAAILTASSGDGGWATLSRVEGALARTGAATNWRLRAFTGWLEKERGLQRGVADGRQKPFRLTGWVIEALGKAGSAACAAASGGSSQSTSAPLRRRIVVTGLNDVCLLGAASGAAIPPVLVDLFDRRGGFVLLARLIGAASRRDGDLLVSDLSRKALARRLHCSRAHVTSMLVRMERDGMVRRLAANEIAIDGLFDATCRAFFEDHLAAIRLAASSIPGSMEL